MKLSDLFADSKVNQESPTSIGGGRMSTGTDLDDLSVEVKIALMLVMKSAFDEIDSLIQSPIQAAPTPKPPRKLRLVKNEEV
jgi:hypothetical protein